jgi:protein lifeguard
MYSTSTVFTAISATAAVSIGLTIYAFTTDNDLTIWGGLLWGCSLGILVLTVVAIVLKVRWLTILVSALTIILFSIYLIYDTQMIIGGRRREFSIDDYILASLELYVDIIILFLEILKTIGSIRNE